LKIFHKSIPYTNAKNHTKFFIRRNMTGLFSIIFIASLILGYFYGWINHFSGIEFFIPVVIGGFFGSSLIAILFTYFYFTHEETVEETDEEKIKRLTNEIAKHKKEK